MHRIVTGNYKGQLTMPNTDYLWQSCQKSAYEYTVIKLTCVAAWACSGVTQVLPNTERSAQGTTRLSIRGTRRPVFWRSELCLFKTRSYPLWRPGWDMMQYSNYLPFYLKRLWKSSIIKINYCLTDGLSWNNARLCSWVLSKNLSHACQP